MTSKRGKLSVASVKTLAIALSAVTTLLSPVIVPATALAAATPPVTVSNPTGGTSNLTTSPITADLLVRPGETKSTTLQVKNNGNTALSIGVQVRTFKANGTNGQASVLTPSVSDPSLSYVRFSRTTFTAQPGVFTPIEMTISLPKEAELGYYYAVLFKPVLPTPTVTNTNKFTLSNAILVLVDTGSSNESRKLSISSFSASKKLYEYLPASFKINVRNEGNIYVAPRGVLTIARDSETAKPITTLDFNKPLGRVLPNSSRDFIQTWDDGFPKYVTKTLDGQPVPDKNGNLQKELKFNFAETDKFRIGKYHARLVMVYNDGQRDIPLYANVSFWVVPWKIILLVIGFILLQILFIVMALRYRKLYRKNRKYVAKNYEE